VSSQVGQEGRQLVIGHLGQAGLDGGPARASPDQAWAQSRARLPDKGLVLLVTHLINALPQGIAARPGEDRLQPAAVLGLEDMPATVAEEGFQAGGADARHDAVKALAVQVDDPEQIPEALDVVLGGCLPHVALI
jgi:hypothetical protein